MKTFLEKLRKECHCLRSMSETLCARCTVCTRKETTSCARHDERSCRHPDCGHYIPLDERILCFKISDLVKPWIKAVDNLSKVRIVLPLPSLPPVLLTREKKSFPLIDTIFRHGFVNSLTLGIFQETC